MKPVTNKQWKLITDAINQLIGNAPVELRGGMGNGEPEVNETSVLFNGEGDDAHETFYLPKNDSTFNFCKTALKPYDLIVVASIIVANAFAPDAYDIGSDGDAEEWSEGLSFAVNTLGMPYLQIPERVTEP